MSKDITTFKGLFARIEKEIPSILQRIGKDVAGVLRFYVQQNWYNYMDSKKSIGGYERTMQVLESITCSKVEKIKNGYKVNIFFDIDKIIPQKQSGLFNAHMSVDGSDMWRGHSVPELLIYWLNHGQNSPIYSFPGVGFWEDTIEFMEDDKYHINMMKEELKSKGFVIE